MKCDLTGNMVSFQKRVVNATGEYNDASIVKFSLIGKDAFGKEINGELSISLTPSLLKSVNLADIMSIKINLKE
jgi:hypothetical protein